MRAESIKLAAISVVSLVGVVGGLIYLMNRTSESVERHPVDPIATHMVTRPFRASLLLGCIQSDAVRADLGLDEEVIAAMDADLEAFDVQQKEIWDQWRADHPEKKWFVPLEPDDLKTLLLATQQSITRRLTAKQNGRLSQIVYQQYGASILFLPEVQDKLKMTTRQCQTFKDRYVHRVKEMNTFDRQFRTATATSRESLQAKRVKLKQELDDQLMDVLRPTQREALAEMLGPMLPTDQESLVQQ